jgi:uncharacterized membrane protein
MSSAHLVKPSRVTRIAGLLSLGIGATTAAFLIFQYQALPDILPVHFTNYGYPNGWQYRTYPRVLIPFFVQAALFVTCGATALLLLSRPHGESERDAPDVRAAAAAGEAVALLALIWIAFQGYAALALVEMWRRQRAGLGVLYVGLEVTGLVLTVIVFARAAARLGRPAARPFVPEHWRLGHLYKNPADPALFVPTRDGTRWTLNFGRPVAAALMALVLGVGILAPVTILRLLLR